jgi:AcrR family transcriptional regulator
VASDQVGLRERKKRATRALIADTALRLFAERGFDQTTVAEVAEAAGVSVKTVFNYFPAKEDLFFDLADEIEQIWLDAVADHRPGESPLAGLRRRVLSRFADHPGGPSARFRKVLAGSTLLQARGQQMWASHEDAITQALAALLGMDGEDPTPRVLAHQVLSIHPMILRMVELWTQRGAAPDEVRDRALRLIDRAFDILERGIPGSLAAGNDSPSPGNTGQGEQQLDPDGWVDGDLAQRPSSA